MKERKVHTTYRVLLLIAAAFAVYSHFDREAEKERAFKVLDEQRRAFVKMAEECAAR